MGNVLGIFNLDGAVLPLDKALAELNFPAQKAKVVSVVSSDSLCRVYVASLGIYGSRVYNSNPLVFLIGKVFNLEALVPYAENSPRQDTEARFLAEALRNDDLLSRLKGDFLLGGYFSDDRTLILANDRCGLRNLYYATLGSGVAFSTRLDVLAMVPGVSSKIYPPGLADYLSFRYVLGEKTLLEGVRQMPAAGKVVVKQGAVYSSVYWRPAVRDRNGSVGRDEVEAVRGLLNASVKRYLVPEWRTAIALTGGFDSRMILSAVVALGGTVSAYTYGIDGATDVAVAKKLAQATGFSHTTHRITVKAVADNLRDTMRLMGSDAAVLCSHPLIFLKESPNSHEITLTGYGGEFMRAYITGHGIDTKGGDEAFCAALYHHLRVGFDLSAQQALFNRAMWEQMHDGPQESLTRVLQTYGPNYTPEQRADLFYLGERCRKFLMMAHKQTREFHEVGFPLADEDLVSAVLSLPQSTKTSAHVTRALIVANAPKLSWVIHERYGVPIRFCGSALGVRLYVTKLIGILLGHRRRPNHRYGEWLRGELFPMVEEVLLSERAMSRGIFEPQALRSFVQECRENRRPKDLRLETALALELWCQEVLDRK